MPECGGNFSFLIDYGGNNKFGCGAKNFCFIQRGSDGGFLISRPRGDEADKTAKKSPPSASAGN
jgi:hypothetical protein